MRFRWTLARLLGAILLAVGLLVALFVELVLDVSEETILRASEQRRSATAQRIGESVRRGLDEASRAVFDVERALAGGLPAEELEPALCLELRDHPTLAELSLTFARDDQLAKLGIERSAHDELAVRRVRRDPSGFVFERKVLREGRCFDASGATTRGEAIDPREHATYSTTASIAGAPLIWSDLAYAEADSTLPVAERRVVVSAQKNVVDREGAAIGVVRAALDTLAVDAIARDAVDPSDPHRIFISDDRGRLITRLDSQHPIVEDDGDLRPDVSMIPAPIKVALHAQQSSPSRGDEEEIAGVVEDRWFYTFRALPGSQDWFVGIVVPSEVYTRELDPLKARLLFFSVAMLLVVLAGGLLALWPIHRNLRRIIGTTERMLRFDFTADRASSSLSDVRDLLDSLERAKTALRALSKYVPIDLVRELYRDNKDPVLGGELRTLSIMFTDIKDFTSVSERLSPDALAHALGLYLDAMTRAIRDAGGTIDKFVGDAVMSLWNAPSPATDHALLACRAALACVEETQKLYATAEWGDRPRFYTRFGIHQDRVIVGNFGAPERMAYTALGDGVNLAARLEGLCKQYGVQILVSEAIVADARSRFAFRRIDRVAVKGRKGGVAVFELLGEAAPEHAERAERARRYETALTAYFARDFAEAIRVLEPALDDPPSRVLLERCRHYEAHPPPDAWDGVFIATSK